MAIIDIRGTNGSGKSWIVHKLLADNTKARILDASGKIVGYHLVKLKTAVMGSYENTCGGCDGIKSADLIEERLRKFAAKYQNVILEGITVSHTYGRYAAIADSLKGEHSYHFMFLDTPLEKCIERVRKRRIEKGNTKPFNPDKKMGLSYDYGRVMTATRLRLIEAGYDVTMLPHKDPLPTVLRKLTCPK